MVRGKHIPSLLTLDSPGHIFSPFHPHQIFAAKLLCSRNRSVYKCPKQLHCVWTLLNAKRRLFFMHVWGVYKPFCFGYTTNATPIGFSELIPVHVTGCSFISIHDIILPRESYWRFLVTSCPTFGFCKIYNAICLLEQSYLNQKLYVTHEKNFYYPK